MGEVPEIPCDPSSTCGANRTLSLLVELVGSKSMAGSDRSSVGSEPAFFKEIMKRDAMIGTRVIPALWDAS